MSVVLYALGVILLVWGGYVLVSGDMIATLDIAASLIGYGAFAIGLGAITGAITRLTRTIADNSVPVRGEQPLDGVAQPRASRPEPRRAPAPVGAAPAVAFQPASKPDRTAEPDLPSPAQAAPQPRSRPRIEIEPAPRPAPAEDPLPESSWRAERRVRPAEVATDDVEVEAPVVVAPILGGGFVRPDRTSDRAAAAPPATPDVELKPVFELEPVVERPEPEPIVEPAIEPEPAPPVTAPTPEPKVPEWLARARARREARTTANERASVIAPSAAPRVEDAVVAPPSTEREDPDLVAEPPVMSDEGASVDEIEPPVVEDPPEEAIADDLASPADASADDTAPERVVLREGEHNGVLYRFFEDGSVEAQSEHGARRFGSLEELRATILAVRGRIDDEAEVDVEPLQEAELMVENDADEHSSAHQFPEPHVLPDETEAPEPTPPAPPKDEFEAALAALEGNGEAASPAGRAVPSLGDVRPSR